MESIQAVLFDYGLVLSGPQDPAAWKAMIQLLGTTGTDFANAYWHHRNDYDRGTLNGEAYWQAVGADLDHGLSNKQLEILIHEDVRLWTQPNKPMIEWAARLQRAGIKTGILSNIGDAMETGIRAEAKWLDDFSHHTFSHRLKLAKPERAIYEHAAKGLGVTTGHVLFIDDRAENIDGAESAGMRAIQYISHEQFAADMRERGFADLLEI